MFFFGGWLGCSLLQGLPSAKVHLNPRIPEAGQALPAQGAQAVPDVPLSPAQGSEPPPAPPGTPPGTGTAPLSGGSGAWPCSVPEVVHQAEPFQKQILM